MNREAAALGVPVYSVFRGRIGAVDQYLASQGRLVLLDSIEDVQTKIVIARRNRGEGWRGPCFWVMSGRAYLGTFCSDF